MRVIFVTAQTDLFVSVRARDTRSITSGSAGIPTNFCSAVALRAAQLWIVSLAAPSFAGFWGKFFITGTSTPVFTVTGTTTLVLLNFAAIVELGIDRRSHGLNERIGPHFHSRVNPDAKCDSSSDLDGDQVLHSRHADRV